jgi:peptidoglycan/xylan/chitin deacetylase (PgdA/CDA1 family)
MSTLFHSATASVLKWSTPLIVLLACSILHASRPRADQKTPSAIAQGTGPLGEIVRGPRGKSEIAITFDAGAEAECFEDLISALESAHVHSTFFVTGNWAQKNRECAAAITKHGHEVGNHTWNHPNLTQQPDNIVREEISRAEVILNELTGQSPRPLWRAPYGERDDRVLRIASNLGYRSIYWTLDSLDGVEPIKTPGFLINRITNKTDTELDGAIILMHVGFKSTAEALPVIIADLQGRGFQLVTVSMLLESTGRRP